MERERARGPALLKEIAKDAAAMAALFVCTVAVFAVLFMGVYRLILLTGWLLLS